MVWLPTPLKGFTDSVPIIKDMLRVCAWHLYGWVCEHESVAEPAKRIRSGWLPEGYPQSWPTGVRRILPKGTAPHSQGVIDNIERTKTSIRQKLADQSPNHYPRQEVLDVLAAWNIRL
jgi:hypothetical protein